MYELRTTTPGLGNARIAIVHEWLDGFYGAERVLEQMLEVFPHADVFAVVNFAPSSRKFLKGKPVKTSFIQKLPFARVHYRKYFFLMPLAIEQHDLSGYDVVISSSHAVAKGVLTGSDQLHIAYTHTPARYVWDLQHQYLNDAGLGSGVLGWVARFLLYRFRQWDTCSSNRVDYFLANSNHVAERIRKAYRRDSVVIYPPVDVEYFRLCENKEDFYLTVSRLVSYKKVGLLVEAFREMGDKKLVVVGDGPDLQKLKSNAPSNVEFVGYVSRDVVRQYMQRAKAFVFAGEEDFGIALVEAQACGTPVIAYNKGGGCESIKGLGEENPTGVFFDDQEIAAIADAVAAFEKESPRIRPINCRVNSLRFGADRFREEFYNFVLAKWEARARAGRGSFEPRLAKLGAGE